MLNDEKLNEVEASAAAQPVAETPPLEESVEAAPVMSVAPAKSPSEAPEGAPEAACESSEPSEAGCEVSESSSEAPAETVSEKEDPVPEAVPVIPVPVPEAEGAKPKKVKKEKTPKPPKEKKSKTEKVKKEKRPKGYLKYSPFSLLLLSACAFVFFYSLLGLLEQTVQDHADEVVIDKVYNIAFQGWGEGVHNVTSVPSTGGGVLAPLPNATDSWQSIKPENVNPEILPFLQSPEFPALKAINAHTVGWLYWPSSTSVDGFPMNQPVVQTKDNEYYLSRNFERQRSQNGSVYMDYRNNGKDISQNRNTILYGHARSYQIFGGLKDLNIQKTWQKDGYNHFIYFNTPTERTVWQVFSWYETTVYFNYIRTDFSSDDAYVSFLEQIQSKNQIPAFEEFTFTPETRILTLSTCKGSDETVRVAVHAVLVKSEPVT